MAKEPLWWKGKLMAITVTVDAQGRITLPANTRSELHIETDDTLEVEARDGGIFLRPATVIPPEDAWAYTPEHRAQVREAQTQTAFAISPDEMAAIIDADDPQAAAEEVIAAHARD